MCDRKINMISMQYNLEKYICKFEQIPRPATGGKQQWKQSAGHQCTQKTV